MKGYDLTNQVFGDWTVIELDELLTKEKKKKYWKCKCSCGTEKSVIQNSLTSGKSKSCGCSKLLKPGDVYGFLKVLEMDSSNKKNRFWKCECLKCHNITSVRTADLKRGHTKSCGCLSKEQSYLRNLNNLLGQTFGDLTVIEQLPSSKNGHAKWLCRCKCGKEIPVFGTNLVRNHTTSCGCNKSSKGEKKIQAFLDNNHISYKWQYTYSDLKNIDLLRFDFAIFKENKLFCLLEYQGEQHYKAIEHWGGEEGLLIRQNNDNLKREYCQKNNILLIEIPYTEYNNIDEILKKKLL